MMITKTFSTGIGGTIAVALAVVTALSPGANAGDTAGCSGR